MSTLAQTVDVERARALIVMMQRESENLLQLLEPAVPADYSVSLRDLCYTTNRMIMDTVLRIRRELAIEERLGHTVVAADLLSAATNLLEMLLCDFRGLNVIRADEEAYILQLLAALTHAPA